MLISFSVKYYDSSYQETYYHLIKDQSVVCDYDFSFIYQDNNEGTFIHILYEQSIYK